VTVDASRDLEIARCIFREASDGFLVFDPRDGRVVDVNPATLRLTGFDRREVLAMRVQDLFSSEGDGLRQLVEALRQTRFFHSREGYTLARREGGPVAVNLSVSRVHTRPEPLGLVVVRDVSELRRSHEALERFFRHSPALFAVLGPDGLIRSTNPAWGRSLGYAPDELVGVSPSGLIHPDDRDEAADATASRPRGSPVVFKARFRRRDGGYAWLSWCAGTIDEVTYAVAIDVTDLKETEALRQAKEDAEAASRAKGRLLANVSHELRTPLGVMLGLIDVLLASSEGIVPERVEHLRAVRRNGEHLTRLIDDLLDLSRAEAGRLEVRLALCRPAEVVAEVVELLGPTAEAKGLDLAADYPATAPGVVRTDAMRLRQILLNLVGNAIKYTERGGVIVRGAPGGSGPGGPLLRIDVTDTGVGLSSEAVAGLFQPFHRGDGARGGTGLGLAISRQLAGLIGGTLDVRSESGRGSTFSLVIPALAADGPSPAEVVRPKAPETPPTPGPAGSRRRVLLAEDNADNRTAVGLRLDIAGIEVTAVGDGQQAIDAALSARDEGRPYDAILMDMQMPTFDGFEATSRLRSAGYRGTIIALTAYARPEDREECLRRGCDEHVAKPIDWDKLLILISAPAPAARRDDGPKLS
jgi:PAS domain S-box-containing protein